MTPEVTYVMKALKQNKFLFLFLVSISYNSYNTRGLTSSYNYMILFHMINAGLIAKIDDFQPLSPNNLAQRGGRRYIHDGMFYIADDPFYPEVRVRYFDQKTFASIRYRIQKCPKKFLCL